MKYIIITVLLLGRFLACQNITDMLDSGGSDSTVVHTDADDVVPATVHRNTSINEANAYSNLFLDSTALEQYIQRNALTTAQAQRLRNFYNNRNYQYAWFSGDGLTEPARGFWYLHTSMQQNNNYKDSSIRQQLEQRMDTLMTEDSLTIHASDSVFINTELQLTTQFLQLIRQPNNDSADLAILHQFIPVKKRTTMEKADSMLHTLDDSSYLIKQNQSYALLKQKLRQYFDVAQQGGWPTIPQGIRKLQKGATSPAVPAIKKRLYLSGDLKNADSSQKFTDSLAAAVRSFQRRYGLQEDGVVTDSLIRIMNVPVEHRIDQIMINLNRMAWMTPYQQDTVIKVNIPDFMLYAYQDSQKVFDMPVVVGKQGSGTVMFSSAINQVVFSPYWNIPRSIVESEIMPAMKNDPNYLKKHNMEIVNDKGAVPEIRQKPGPENALGKVKFLFPNTFDIYLHDTPKKSLFNQQKRAFSHGCIRVANAEKLAQYLLQNNDNWTPEKIRTAMNSGNEQYVNLKNPMPVAITYLTAWVDKDGQLNFREDIYGHDRAEIHKMFVIGG